LQSSCGDGIRSHRKISVATIGAIPYHAFYKYGDYMTPLAISSSILALCIALGIPSIGTAGDVVLQKAPPLTVRQAPSYPENLARYHFGAAVKATPQTDSIAKLQLSSNGIDRNTSAAALLCDDPTTGYQIPGGASSILVSLANIENIQAISFLNDGAQGEYTIATSNAGVPANSPEWRQVAPSAMSQGVVSAKIGPGEAKYVRLSFNITRPGRIAAFGVYATPALSDFTMPRPRKVSFEEEPAAFALITFNFSDLHARARGLYVSSGDAEQANNMIDDQPATSYEFASGDPTPTSVIDLGRERTLTRLSAIFATQPGSFEFYVLPSLPLGDGAASDVQEVANVGPVTDLPTSLTISERTFAGLKPVGSVVSTGAGRASVDFPEVAGRYVMLTWHPASARGDAFSIAQVAAFGVSKRDNQVQEMDGKETMDGKEVMYGEGGKEPLAEAPIPAEGPPPILPPVPGPFVFIPQVPPTSP
jgi:hypothetical protein